MTSPATPSSRIERRAFSTHPPRALLIGASTGGPQALMALVEPDGYLVVTGCYASVDPGAVASR